MEALSILLGHGATNESNRYLNHPHSAPFPGQQKVFRPSQNGVLESETKCVQIPSFIHIGYHNWRVWLHCNTIKYSFADTEKFSEPNIIYIKSCSNHRNKESILFYYQKFCIYPLLMLLYLCSAATLPWLKQKKKWITSKNNTKERMAK